MHVQLANTLNRQNYVVNSVWLFSQQKIIECIKVVEKSNVDISR